MYVSSDVGMYYQIVNFRTLNRKRYDLFFGLEWYVYEQFTTILYHTCSNELLIFSIGKMTFSPGTLQNTVVLARLVCLHLEFGLRISLYSTRKF